MHNHGVNYGKQKHVAMSCRARTKRARRRDDGQIGRLGEIEQEPLARMFLAVQDMALLADMGRRELCRWLGLPS